MKRTTIAVALVFATGSVGAFAAERTISQKGKVFSESAVTIKKGDTLVFLNDDTVSHNVLSTTSGHNFNLGSQAPGVSTPHNFGKPGEVEVVCAIHPRMKLTVTVTDQAADASSLTTGSTDGSGLGSGSERAQRSSESAVSRARAVKAKFNEARAAMERALLLPDATLKAEVATLEAAMSDVFQDMKTIERMGLARSTSFKNAEGQIRDWYESGLKIVRPPADGLVEVPMPMSVRSKARVVASALDQVVAQAAMAESRQRAVRAKKQQEADAEAEAQASAEAHASSAMLSSYAPAWIAARD
jgi:plastocyanin